MRDPKTSLLRASTKVLPSKSAHQWLDEKRRAIGHAKHQEQWWALRGLYEALLHQEMLSVEEGLQLYELVLALNPGNAGKIQAMSLMDKLLVYYPDDPQLLFRRLDIKRQLSSGLGAERLDREYRRILSLAECRSDLNWAYYAYKYAQYLIFVEPELTRADAILAQTYLVKSLPYCEGFLYAYWMATISYLLQEYGLAREYYRQAYQSQDHHLFAGTLQMKNVFAHSAWIALFLGRFKEMGIWVRRLNGYFPEDPVSKVLYGVWIQGRRSPWRRGMDRWGLYLASYLSKPLRCPGLENTAFALGGQKEHYQKILGVVVAGSSTTEKVSKILYRLWRQGVDPGLRFCGLVISACMGRLPVTKLESTVNRLLVWHLNPWLSPNKGLVEIGRWKQSHCNSHE